MSNLDKRINFSNLMAFGNVILITIACWWMEGYLFELSIWEKVVYAIPVFYLYFSAWYIFQTLGELNLKNDRLSEENEKLKTQLKNVNPQ